MDVMRTSTVFFCLLIPFVCPRTGSAGLSGYFRQLEAGKTTDSLVYAGAYDTYLFEMVSTDVAIDAMQLSFISSSGSFINTFDTTFRDSATNPTFIGIETPETFFIIPPGTTAGVGSQADNSHTLLAAYFASPPNSRSVPLVDTIENSNFVPTPVAFFSVPAGTRLNAIANLDLANSKWINNGMDISIFNSQNSPFVSTRSASIQIGATISQTFNAVSLVGNDLSWTDFTFSGPSPFHQPTFDYNTHELQWDSAGSPAGTYLASVTVADIVPFGSNSPPAHATFTIQVVPEPIGGLIWGFIIAALGSRLRRISA